MGYLYLLCVALMFSFGGTCVKLISPYYAPEFIKAGNTAKIPGKLQEASPGKLEMDSVWRHSQMAGLFYGKLRSDSRLILWKHRNPAGTDYFYHPFQRPFIP